MPESQTPQTDTWPYAVPRKALQKWARERVLISDQPDGSTLASFHYSGSTCSNLGHPLNADLTVTLSPADADGRRWITATGCKPTEVDPGVAKMCACLQAPDRFLSELDRYSPLQGMDLDSAIRWEPSIEMAGCLCAVQSRNHKWRNAIQTIHYTLEQPSQESNTRSAS